MQTINLNLVPGKVKPVVHSSQYDKGRTFRCYLFDGSTNYTLDGTETITIEGQKSDSHIFLPQATGDDAEGAFWEYYKELITRSRSAAMRTYFHQNTRMQ